MQRHRPNPDIVRVAVRAEKTGNRCATEVCLGCLGCPGIFNSTDIFFDMLVFTPVGCRTIQFD